MLRSLATAAILAALATAAPAPASNGATDAPVTPVTEAPTLPPATAVPSTRAGRAPSGSATASPPPLTYFYTPPPLPYPTSYSGFGAPQILQIALSGKILITPGIARVYVRTNPEVVSVTARALIKEIDLPKIRPGEFGGTQYVPRLPDEFLNRYYDVDFIAATADGRTTTVTLSLGLR